ncbi:MAG: 4-phosphopantoate--beta-alanine ligase [Thermoplasmata archaeon]|nr:4-phosphopantoate--beta-alanine ligase [Thermoplasmata archaeon]
MEIPKSHPRYVSLLLRERIIEGWKEGIVADAGLLAHGRGEAFDYLIGEITQPFALHAMKVALHHMLNAKNSVISVNGNVCALCAGDIVKLARATNSKLEINLFYRTEARVQKIAEKLREAGAEKIFGVNPDARIPGLEHLRALCSRDGMYTADVVFVPLEDGDRVEALKKMGKFVIALDLNPLSRTARSADVTIVDNLVRAVPKMVEIVKSGEKLEIEGYDNGAILGAAKKKIWEVLSEH